MIINNENENPKNKFDIIEQYIICPKCNINIPALPFFLNSIEIGGSIEILINCRCGNKDRIPLDDCFNYDAPTSKINVCEECLSNKPKLNLLFCINCSKWLCEECRENFKNMEENHHFCKIPFIVNEFCDIHINYENLFYCYDCKKELCIKCTKFHPKNHKYINLIEYYEKVKESPSAMNFEKEIELVFKKNEDLKKNCLDIIEKLEDENDINNNNNNFDINIEKEKFLDIYNKNLLLNKQLNKFVHILYKIFISANNHPNYNIIHNFELASYINKDNFPEIENEEKNNINNHYSAQYKKILKYFKENTLLSIKSLIFISEEKTYFDNINVKNLIKINNESFVFTSNSSFEIFNINSKESKLKADNNNKEITKILLLKNGKLVIGSKDGEIRFWTIDSYIILDKLLTDHKSEISELIELFDGNLLSGDVQGKIMIHNFNEISPIKTFLLNSNIIGVFEIKQKEYFIASEKSFCTYQNNKKSTLLNFDKNKINCVLFIKNAVICANDDKNIQVYEIKPFKKINNLSVNANIIRIKDFTHKYFYGISSEYTLHFFNFINYEQLFCINVKTYNFYEFLVMNDSYVYTGSNNGLTEWNSNLSMLIDDLVENIVLV